ncbi:MAG: type II secretion system protein [Candidatus Kerfeldbacteria bacterium]|nr:type II secretion system protein [Candidatus Kerfeldbacteria bacterium]
MNTRHGFTLFEFLIVMGIFVLALTFVFFNFRAADRREQLQGLSLAALGMAKEAQSWALGNHYDSTIDGSDGAGDGIPDLGYALVLGVEANPAWAPRIQAVQAFGATPLVSTAQTLGAEVTTNDLAVVQVHAQQDDSLHCVDLGAANLLSVVFRAPDGRPVLNVNQSSTTLTEGMSTFIYFEQLTQNLCRRLTVLSSGQASETDAPCPGACTPPYVL